MSYLERALKAAANRKSPSPDQEEASIRLQYFLAHPVADRVQNCAWIKWRRQLSDGVTE